MKKSTRIFLLAFAVVAIILYAIIFLFPEMRGLTNETMTLEYGASPVSEEATVYFVRDEALFYATTSGKMEYLQTEGTKVRKGVKILNIIPEPITKEEGESEFAEILEIAGNTIVASTDDAAHFTAILSFHADGFERIITPDTIDSLKEEELEKISEGVDLKREFTYRGEPIFKLTDNNLWYMVYWTKGLSNKQIEELRGEDGRKVTVEINSTRITATVDSIKKSNGKQKVVLRSDMFYDDMHLKRKSDAHIIYSEHQGPIISPNSVVEREEGPGVYVKQRTGGFKWIPIRILESKSTEERLIIAVKEYLNDDGEIVETVNYYDEILLNPKQKGYN